MRKRKQGKESVGEEKLREMKHFQGIRCRGKRIRHSVFVNDPEWNIQCTYRPMYKYSKQVLYIESILFALNAYTLVALYIVIN